MDKQEFVWLEAFYLEPLAIDVRFVKYIGLLWIKKTIWRFIILPFIAEIGVEVH